jgi:hypothetical protein
MYLSNECQYEIYEVWKIYLCRFPWQWMATLTTQVGTNFFRAQNLIKEWTLEICLREKIQVGYFGISSHKKGYLHFHLLMLGHNRDKKSLTTVSKHLWETRWRFNARIQEIYDIPSACDYFAKHTLGWRSDHHHIDSYNKSLLKKVMTVKNDGLDLFGGI